VRYVCSKRTGAAAIAASGSPATKSLKKWRRYSLLHRGPSRAVQLDCRGSVLRIADAEQRSGFLSSLQRLRDHEGNGLSPVFDLCRLEGLETLDRRSPCERKLDRPQAIEVLVRQDQEHTGRVLGAALVDPRDAALPNSRHNWNDVDHLWQDPVRSIDRLTADLVGAVDSLRVFPKGRGHARSLAIIRALSTAAMPSGARKAFCGVVWALT
jgi:hypothetical protein